MNKTFTADAAMPSYLVFPRALLTEDLSAAELSVYMLLLDRARLSARSEAWQDSRGQVYLYFPVLKLAEAIGRSDTAVKKALRGLEEKDLISRKRQGLGKPSRIYVKLPEAGKEASPAESTFSSPPVGTYASPAEGTFASPAESTAPSPAERKEASPPWGRRLPPNKNYREKTSQKASHNAPTREEYNRMLSFLERLERTEEERRQAPPLTPPPPEPSPGRPPSYP